MNAEEEIKVNLRTVGEGMSTLQDDFKKLLAEYEFFFSSAINSTGHLEAYLKTWAELEKKMPLNLDDTKSNKITQVIAATCEVTTTATITLGELVKKKEAVFKLTDRFAECKRFVSRTFPNTALCLAEIKKVDDLYKNEMANHIQMKNQLVVMSGNLDKAEKLLKEIIN